MEGRRKDQGKAGTRKTFQEMEGYDPGIMAVPLVCLYDLFYIFLSSERILDISVQRGNLVLPFGYLEPVQGTLYKHYVQTEAENF